MFGEMMELLPEQYEKVLRKLDELEEYDPLDEKHSVYLRRRTVAVLEHGERVAVWAYYWNCPEISGRRIRSGDFTCTTERLQKEEPGSSRKASSSAVE